MLNGLTISLKQGLTNVKILYRFPTMYRILALGLIISLLPCCLSHNIQGIALNNTFTLGLTIPWVTGWKIGYYIGSAIILGIEEVQRRQILQGYDIEWVWRDSQCEPKRGVQMAVDMWDSVPDLDAILGDGCSNVCQPVSLLASAWGIPMMSWGCTSASLSDKTKFPVFSRVEGTFLSFAPILNAVSDFFNWNTVAVLCTPEDIWKMTAHAIVDELQAHGKTAMFRVFLSTMRGGDIHKENMQVSQLLWYCTKIKCSSFILSFIGVKSYAIPQSHISAMNRLQREGSQESKCTGILSCTFM